MLLFDKESQSSVQTLAQTKMTKFLQKKCKQVFGSNMEISFLKVNFGHSQACHDGKPAFINAMLKPVHHIIIFIIACPVPIIYNDFLEMESQL